LNSQYFDISLTNKNHPLSYFAFFSIATIFWLLLLETIHPQLSDVTVYYYYFFFFNSEICIQISNIEIHKVCMLTDPISVHSARYCMSFSSKTSFLFLEFHLLVKTKDQERTRVQLPLVIRCQSKSESP